MNGPKNENGPENGGDPLLGGGQEVLLGMADVYMLYPPNR